MLTYLLISYYSWRPYHTVRPEGHSTGTALLVTLNCHIPLPLHTAPKAIVAMLTKQQPSLSHFRHLHITVGGGPVRGTVLGKDCSSSCSFPLLLHSPAHLHLHVGGSVELLLVLLLLLLQDSVASLHGQWQLLHVLLLLVVLHRHHGLIQLP
jgi:hypothetical protein